MLRSSNTARAINERDYSCERLILRGRRRIPRWMQRTQRRSIAAGVRTGFHFERRKSATCRDVRVEKLLTFLYTRDGRVPICCGSECCALGFDRLRRALLSINSTRKIQHECDRRDGADQNPPAWVRVESTARRDKSRIAPLASGLKSLPIAFIVRVAVAQFEATERTPKSPADALLTRLWSDENGILYWYS